MNYMIINKKKYNIFYILTNVEIAYILLDPLFNCNGSSNSLLGDRSCQ